MFCLLGFDSNYVLNFPSSKLAIITLSFTLTRPFQGIIRSFSAEYLGISQTLDGLIGSCTSASHRKPII